MKWRLVVVGALGLAAPACLPCDREAPVESAAQLDALAHCEVLQGSLLIQSIGDLQFIQLPNLREVTGGLVIAENPLLSLVSLPVLSAVNTEASAGGQVAGLSVSGNEVLEGLELPSLATVGTPDADAGLDLSRLPALQALELANLEALHGGLTVVDTGLPAFALDTALELTGLFVTRNRELTTLSLPALTRVDQEVVINDNLGLVDVDLSGLQIVKPAVGPQAGRVEFANNFALERVVLDALAEVGLVVHVELNPQLIALSLPAASGEVPVLQVLENANLASVAAAGVTSIQTLRISQNRRLASIDFAALTRVESFEVSENAALPTCAVEDLAGQLDPQGFVSFSAYNNLEDACGRQLDQPPP